MTEVQRRGGKFEAAGFVLILLGGALCLASGALGVLTIVIGFCVFLVGRFM